MRDYKTKKNGAKKTVNFHSRLVAKDRRLKNLEHAKETDMGIFSQGYDWFNKGLSLEDAPSEIRNNFNFINGFEKARRVKNINDNLETLGMEWFQSGLSLEEAPVNYGNNPYFRNGYENAANKTSGRKL